MQQFISEISVHNAIVILLAILLPLFYIFYILTNNRKKDVIDTIKSSEKLTINGPYSINEVAKHCVIDDAWIIVDDKVYDITSYIDSHPGGEAIAKNLGQDNSLGVRGPQHPPSVWDVLAVYYVGDLKN